MQVHGSTCGEAADLTPFNAAKLARTRIPAHGAGDDQRGLVSMTAYGRPRGDHAERPDRRRLALELLGQALALFDDDHDTARCRVEDAFALLSGSPEVKRAKHRMLTQWKIQEAEEYINAHLGSCLRIRDVARAVDMSTGYFSRAFKKAAGISYSEYVTRNRLERAKRMLLTSNSPIAEVALACGLADQAHLTRLFSRSEGLPPRDWRRMLRDCVADPKSRLRPGSREVPPSAA
ncbi:helix-turn-helix transcriptional regulator [Rhodopseudomonas sp. B29]|uniref:helix-turn-helix transcriptional regulator n=1 Tax=Rhodopseudomonas sp. B29 TaxID=95607 RepID=UPI0009FFAF27|nr:AraC family transcriptional regulator [Rhodopseudomonas sp. B29]